MTDKWQCPAIKDTLAEVGCELSISILEFGGKQLQLLFKTGQSTPFACERRVIKKPLAPPVLVGTTYTLYKVSDPRLLGWTLW